MVNLQSVYHPIDVIDLKMTYGSHAILQGVNFHVNKGEIFAIVGNSGCGKSTLQRHLIGLQKPNSGKILYAGRDFWDMSSWEQTQCMQRFGVLFQEAALWSFLTLLENVLLPLQLHSRLSFNEAKEIATLKLAYVGLNGFEDFYPSQLSGGMRKRAGIARAIALDPEILFLDEPTSGLDPLTARRLDDLIQQIKECLGTTVIMVSHDLASIWGIAGKAIFLDSETKTLRAQGTPKELANSDCEKIRQFFDQKGKIRAHNTKLG